MNKSKRDKSIINNTTENSGKLADITRKKIEKSFNINNTQNIEAYYSDRYGWTLRKIIV